MISSLQMRRCMQLRVPPAIPAGSYTGEIADGPSKSAQTPRFRACAGPVALMPKHLPGGGGQGPAALVELAWIAKLSSTLPATGQRIVT
jgi:hypothetical protein